MQPSFFKNFSSSTYPIYIFDCIIYSMDKYSTMQDKELVALFKEGSQIAFEQLYLRHSHQLITFCKRFLKNQTDAEDIVHDVFFQLLETRDTLNIRSSFSGFIYTLAQNKILYKFRKSDIHLRFTQYLLLNGKDSTNETEDEIINNDYSKLLNQFIESLPPQQKKIFLLNRIDGYTYKEISELLQISTDNVRNNFFLALKKLKKQLLQHTDIHFQTITGFLMFFS